MNSITPIIMAGGTGSRLWPMSRELYPKQFLPLINNQTMLQNTILRLKGLSCNNPLVICNEEHRFLAAEQLLNISALQKNIILEPCGRNTAPAVALAALIALKSEQEDPLLLVLAADHVIEDQAAFHSAISQAIPYAEQGSLVTFGIVPTHAETGYGYIHRGEQLADSIFKVDKFVEKPDYKTACEYLDSKCFYWNSGMFLFKASEYISELKKFRPDILKACEQAIANSENDLDFIRVNGDIFASCPGDSIDYAVMEKTDNAVVVPMSAGWSDVGSWSSLWDVSDKDNDNNVIKGDVFPVASSNNYISSGSMFVATVGVNNLVIVQTNDALLVADKSKVQDVKNIVSYLKSNGRTEHKMHQDIYRPWGKITSVDSGERYQVNRITVKPGEKISSQTHYHRAEHWIVVAGTAKVTKGDSDSILTENESVYIPIGVNHVLENVGRLPLEIIEIQSGVYLGADDVLRK
ncbi:mannose-1-phosphate guanylyltransferase/mannose-6-phosphate isomerase [Kluyvera intermedia]|uniref:mannose-1-phosphate guanylyltransferase/mannose-6-phosphate isomerase n=1 Tax=Kluyvera intermedia TaxID=61648 RepID=UPI003526BDB2